MGSETDLLPGRNWEEISNSVRGCNDIRCEYFIPLMRFTDLNANDMKDFMTFLSFTFRNHPESALIEQREIWLFTPSLNMNKWWYLLTDSDWSATMRPGSRLEMSFNLRCPTTTIATTPTPTTATISTRCQNVTNLPDMKTCLTCLEKILAVPQNREYCHGCSPRYCKPDRSSQFSQIRFSTPMPPWAQLPADLEFRWM
jgi:hypothetical protein